MLGFEPAIRFSLLRQHCDGLVLLFYSENVKIQVFRSNIKNVDEYSSMIHIS